VQGPGSCRLTSFQALVVIRYGTGHRYASTACVLAPGGRGLRAVSSSSLHVAIWSAILGQLKLAEELVGIAACNK
jgi:hypothetical protein